MSTSQNIASASARRAPGLRPVRSRRLASVNVFTGRIATVGIGGESVAAGRASPQREGELQRFGGQPAPRRLACP